MIKWGSLYLFFNCQLILSSLVPLMGWAEGLSLSSLKKNGMIWLDTSASFPAELLGDVRLGCGFVKSWKHTTLMFLPLLQLYLDILYVYQSKWFKLTLCKKTQMG